MVKKQEKKKDEKMKKNLKKTVKQSPKGKKEKQSRIGVVALFVCAST